jgi:hypothetical protein
MACHEREIAMEFNRKHKKPRMAVEYSFNQQITQFPHIDVPAGIKLHKAVG